MKGSFILYFIRNLKMNENHSERSNHIFVYSTITAATNFTACFSIYLYKFSTYLSYLYTGFLQDYIVGHNIYT